VSFLTVELMPKRLELLSELVPTGQDDRAGSEPEQSECRAHHAKAVGSSLRERLAAEIQKARTISELLCDSLDLI
jgi:hypothetical protein